MSSMSDPTVAAETHIYGTLAAAPALAGLGIYPDGVPDDVDRAGAYPCIVYQNQSGGATISTTANADPVLARTQYLVKVIGKTSNFESIAPVSAAIYAALQQSKSGAVLACYREDVYRDESTEDDGEYRQLGHLFTLIVT